MKAKCKINWMLLLLLTFFTVFGQSVKAQQTSTEPQIIKGDANAGELNSASLDYLVNEHQSTGERFFVIARLGRGETARLLNQKRLQAARYFLLEMKRLGKEQIVFAEGEPIAGEGRIEFYLGSHLKLVSLAARGKNVSLICCVGDEPPRKIKK